MKKMKSLLLASFFLFLGMNTFAQNKIEANDLTQEWTLIQSVDGVEMYIKYGECQMGNIQEAFEYGMLKIVNTTNSEKQITYNFEILYSDGCVGCDTNEDEYSSIIIPANSTKTGDCENGLSVLLKNPLQTALTDFQYIQLTTLKVN